MHMPSPFGAHHIRDEEVLQRAAEILDLRMRRVGRADSVEAMKAFLVARLGGLQNEAFHAIWLDTRGRIITHESLFQGGIDGAEIHVRYVIQRALLHNAAAVIFSHCHPSGDPLPSAADRNVTCRLADALRLFEIRVTDHIVVAGNQTYSFAEHGLL